jgi:lipopolysaccharide transport system permease protein
MFLTPVLYPVPQSWPGSLSLALNPIGTVLDTTRAWLLAGVPAHIDGFLITAAFAIVILLFGWLLYRLALPLLLERISA